MLGNYYVSKVKQGSRLYLKTKVFRIRDILERIRLLGFVAPSKIVCLKRFEGTFS
jgi:hypothetical protein